MTNVKCVFLDRDGVLNQDFVDYAYTPEKFILLPGIDQAITKLKSAGFLVIVLTNQSGIAKGIYTRTQMQEVNQIMQEHVDHQIDAIYYAPGHPSRSETLSRKPDSLMFERAMAKFQLKPAHCWMVGDKQRDLIPAKKFGMSTIQVGGHSCEEADLLCPDLPTAVQKILERD
jgi:D-glycero-D-manno-heptose 1,7-bisphosphate phosphatase